MTSDRMARMSDPAEPASAAADAKAASPAARIGADLWPRVGSGIVLAVLALGATVAGSWWFAALVTVVCGVVAWEWGRIVRGREADLAMIAHVAAVLVGIGLAATGLPVLGAVAVAIGTILVGLLAFGRQALLSGLGVMFAGLPGIALIWLRADEPYGVWAVLFLLAAVAATDTSAYFAGRLVGGPKLWPAVSPKKTWAGLVGALVGAAAVAAAFAVLLNDASPLRLAAAGAAIAVVAQAGDLAESALKRKFAAKDASNLIPGHGGFMDRVDGLVAAAISAAAVALWLDIAAPARALLLG